ncbi:MAG: hypothetical protein HWE11_06210 [Gammaproteobacteria bacterium]|nr:hypothetical protein [Gammaproteobacteria bacterium]
MISRVLLFIIILLLGAYGLLEQLTYGTTVIHKIAYASVVLGVFVAIFYFNVLSEFNARALLSYFALTLLNCIWLLYFLDGRPLGYLVVDFVINQVLCLAVFSFGSRGLLSEYGKLLLLLCIFLLIIQVGLVVAGSPFQNGRFNPLSPFFLSLLLVYANNKKIFSFDIFYLIFSIVLILTFMSGERTSLILLIFILMALKVIFSRYNIYFKLSIFAFFFVLFVLSIPYVVEMSRFSILTSGEVDGSLLQRYNEVFDVYLHIRHTWTPFDYLLGEGHGATYLPVFSFSESNILPSGMVHHIHATPVIIFFRYGIVGATIFLAILFSLVKRFSRFSSLSNEQKVVCLSMGCYLQSALFRNVLVDPFFVITLILYFGNFKNEKA